MVINEVNTGNPGIIEKKNFIELKIICDGGRSLRGYKLIGISAGTGHGSNVNSMTVDLVVSLWNSKVGENGMFTIGAGNVPNVDMSSESEFVSYRNKFLKNTPTRYAFFNKGNKHVHAIALLYKNSYSFPELVINDNKQYIPIDSQIEELIKSNLIDLVVYGRKAPYHYCEIFINLYNEYATKDWQSRQYEPQVNFTTTMHSMKSSPIEPIERVPFAVNRYKNQFIITKSDHNSLLESRSQIGIVR